MVYPSQGLMHYTGFVAQLILSSICKPAVIPGRMNTELGHKFIGVILLRCCVRFVKAGPSVCGPDHLVICLLADGR